jgi:hypothetical protein
VFPAHQVGIRESGLPRSAALRNQSCNGTASPLEVEDDLTLGRLTPARTLTSSFAPTRRIAMSSEPPTTAVPVADSAERGLLIVVLVMVLLGVGAMLFMS